ncbi:hypothetical protein A4A49_58876, partial [Nicotiana attenuata]
MEEEKKLARHNRINMRKQKRQKNISADNELDDVNIDGDVEEINDATEDEEDYEDPDVGYGNIDNEEYWDIGDPTYECEHCGAYFWYEERINKKIKAKKPEFSLCCNHGKIVLPKPKEPP